MLRELVIALLLSLSFTKIYAQQEINRSGQPFEIQLTPYKTTILADGKDYALITVKIVDRFGNEVLNAKRSLSFNLKGNAQIINISNKNATVIYRSKNVWKAIVIGSCNVILQGGKSKSVIKFEVKGDSLYPGSTEIHAVIPGKPHTVSNIVYHPRQVKEKILGADISFLPELEAKGVKFSDNGIEKDALQLLKEHGFNFIRLRIFNDPASSKGYAPGKGFCDLEHTKQMAKRIKKAGMKFLLDFHYSDYWADPGQQNKPYAWIGQDFTQLKRSLHDFTIKVMNELKAQGTTPDMVQIGNEINHGMVWPDGEISNLDSLSELIYNGILGVKEINPSTIIMLHIALGGQNQESRFFLDNMAKRNVPFDIIGLSYYPKWHGTLSDLKNNTSDLAMRYHKQIIIAEYTQLKKEVNDIAFNIPGNKGIGTFIWEPLNTWEKIFDSTGKTNPLINIYSEIAKKYLIH